MPAEEWMTSMTMVAVQVKAHDSASYSENASVNVQLGKAVRTMLGD